MVWLAFGMGILLGVTLGIFILGLFQSCNMADREVEKLMQTRAKTL